MTDSKTLLLIYIFQIILLARIAIILDPTESVINYRSTAVGLHEPFTNLYFSLLETYHYQTFIDVKHLFCVRIALE